MILVCGLARFGKQISWYMADMAYLFFFAKRYGLYINVINVKFMFYGFSAIVKDFWDNFSPYFNYYFSNFTMSPFARFSALKTLEPFTCAAAQ